MEVILKEDIKGIGKKGDLVKVKEGYAKNFLFPQKKAVLAVEGEVKKIEQQKAADKKKEEKKKDEAKELAAKLNNKTITLKVKAGKDGKTFGAVTHKDIEEEIEKVTGLKVDKKKIILEEEHIKKTGNYKAEVKFLTDVKATINITIIAE